MPTELGTNKKDHRRSGKIKTTKKALLKIQTQIYFLHGQILPHSLENSTLRINTKLSHEPLVVLGHLDASKTQK